MYYYITLSRGGQTGSCPGNLATPCARPWLSVPLIDPSNCLEKTVKFRLHVVFILPVLVNVWDLADTFIQSINIYVYRGGPRGSKHQLYIEVDHVAPSINYI